nr:uncharacterized protein [Candida metapsilosis]
MNYHLFIITLFTTLLTPVLAGVKITSPEEGDKFSGSSGEASIKVNWKDDSDSDSDSSFELSNVQSYTLSLCTNGNPIQCLDPSIKSQKLTSNSATVTVKQDDVPSGYYFIQVYAVFKSGTTITYTPRFQLTDMEGSSGTLTVTVTGDQPDGQTSESQSSGADTSKSFTVPYTLQTGRTRYAPMQMQPGSTVTATTWTMRFPTSAVTYYSTKHSKPTVYSTITPGWSYTASSEVNWATIAPYPTNWYAASERKLSKASITATQKKRRWVE